MSKTTLDSFNPDAFRAMRENAGLTMIQVAASAGLRPATISAWEHGRSQPTLEALTRTLPALNADITDVIDPPWGQGTLTDLRTLASATRAQVSEFLGISASGWAQIERGETPLSRERAEALAPFLDCSPETVLQAARGSRRAFEERHNIPPQTPEPDTEVPPSPEN